MLHAHVSSICDQFAVSGNCIKTEELYAGLINCTYAVSYEDEDGIINKYIIQRINRSVFKDPEKVMQNVLRVTEHISSKKSAFNTNETLKVFKTLAGHPYHKDEKGDIWRCYNHISNSTTFDTVETAEQAYQAAKAFGEFIDLLSDLPATGISETIPDFHNTEKRYQDLLSAIESDPHGRVHKVQGEIDFITKREEVCNLFTSLQKEGVIPTRITHNDTKINNVMFDANSHEAICVIDLDTIMPGVSLYDFGDLVRTCVSQHEEDATDLTTVKIRSDVYVAATQGFIDGCKSLTQTEIDLLPLAGKVITLETGIRFLTDYLNGDEYFKVRHENQNLDRCRTQLKLVEELETTE